MRVYTSVLHVRCVCCMRVHTSVLRAIWRRETSSSIAHNAAMCVRCVCCMRVYMSVQHVRNVRCGGE